MTRLRIDHVGVETSDLESDLAALSGVFGLSVIRRGTHTVSGTPIALLRAVGGMKVELVEVESIDPHPRSHLAFRCADAGEVGALAERLSPGSPANVVRIEAARADSAFVTTRGGVSVQLICYDATSPDIESETP